MDWRFEEGRIYGVDENGDLMCETTYIRKGNGIVDIDHTYVNPCMRGQGIASKMMFVVSDFLRKEGLTATATCSYANLWFMDHKEEYPDIISDQVTGQDLSCKIGGKH